MSLYREQVGALDSPISDSGHRSLHDRGGSDGPVDSCASPKRSPLTFFVLVFVLSIPSWLIEPRDWPITASVGAPLIAALSLTYKEDGLAGGWTCRHEEAVAEGLRSREDRAEALVRANHLLAARYLLAHLRYNAPDEATTPRQTIHPAAHDPATSCFVLCPRCM
jgi:hypothetical protein